MYPMPTFNPIMWPQQPFMGGAQGNPQSGIQGVTEVHGYQGAMDCQVPAGTTAMLIDAEEPLFYIKEVNTQGIATIKRFKFEAYDPAQEQAANFVTREEFDKLKEQLNESLSQSTQSANSAQATPVQHAGSASLRPTNEPTASAATGAEYAQQWANQSGSIE